MKIAFLSCDSLDGYVSDDELMVKTLLNAGHEIETVSWSEEKDWSVYEAVIVRTTWDYVKRSQEFLQKLKLISQATKLYNSLKTIEWNIHKKYLIELQDLGASVVPTVMFSHEEELKIPSDWDYQRFVIKPAISATSYKTVIYSREEIHHKKHQSELTPGDWMCQPFLEEIKNGEVSLVYFNKVFSHGLIKVPRPDDFRVQEEFGGDIKSYTPSSALVALGNDILGKIPDDLLYARVDVVNHRGRFLLMELELIEPSLYFRTHEGSSQNFLKAMQDVGLR